MSFFIEGCSGGLEQMTERDLNPSLSWGQVHQTTPVPAGGHVKSRVQIFSSKLIVREEGEKV